ncbi:hypothetical protein MtrunA17_Chr5g0420601 [Medicago truncatula]|uniref:Carboxy-terminal lantibiotic dehydratase n=1 Tax=Medicago truncatula TaxID=3880 RepID=G7JZA6_MEDTR|nr:uncharacterized protein LOC120580505 [Medicago truncatula]AES97291.2 carboxy-terminal lantibiotic dehydratase [Medicago truncatula]RHN55683.1 hypothetical protein MtrunA17_Chr5g0420601 [Medicago truncatula]
MFVKDVPGKELLEHNGQKCVRNSPQEAPTNNFPDTPLKTVEVKRPRLEVSSSAPVQIPGNNQQGSSEWVDEMWTSFFTEINSSGDGDTTSVWDDNFPFGGFINKHFSQEKFHEKVKELEFERVLQTSLTDSVRTTFLLHVMGLKLGDTVKENKAYVGEITELKNKLSEYEKNYVGEITELKKKLSDYEKDMAQLTNLKDELKKTLEETILEKRRMAAREKDLMDENSKNKGKLLVKEDAYKVTVDKLKAEIEELKYKMSVQYKAGYDKAVKQVVFFASGLKP